MTASSEETRVQPVEVTCPGCFHPREWDAAGVCPICHYRAGLEGQSAALLPVGTQLKGYVVGEKLGQGGFGITYRGFDVTLKMKVAVKEYYPSEFVGRSTNRKMVVLNVHEHEDLFHYGLKTFLQEAQTIAQLRHPHLVRVINFFELNDTAYLVMDYYEGEDLARHLKPPRRGQPGVRLPWRRAIKLLLPVLDGLQKVHQAGFMHRDIKPGNLYLNRDDELILLDFGSARQVSSTHTRSLLIFSEGFAPYEQYLQGHLNRQGPWTDVYAVAATLYFMLTGQRLPSALDRKQAELLQQPDLLKPARQVIPDLPPGIDAALLRALAVEPEQRLQSMTAFKQHLEAALAEEEKPRPTPPPESPTPPQVAPKPPIPPKAA
ncbi:MAG: serine/threonine-protein kinase, partial [Candidatus Competibacter sp.]